MQSQQRTGYILKQIQAPTIPLSQILVYILFFSPTQGADD